MKCHSLVRGVVVSTTAVGESNNSVGIYTEQGLIYAMAYGGRSLKSKLSGSNALFTMGRFALEESKGQYYKIYDVFVHEHCYELSASLSCYYAACVCVELVKYLEGSQHDAQFKALVDALLYLLGLCRREKVEHKLCTHATLLVYLFRSLCCNGWHPQQLEHSHHVGTDHFSLDMRQGAFVPLASAGYKSTIKPYISRTCIDAVQQTLAKPFAMSVDHVCDKMASSEKKELSIAVKHLLETWQLVLERTFRAALFVTS